MRLPRGAWLGYRLTFPVGELYGSEPTPCAPRSHIRSTGFTFRLSDGSPTKELMLRSVHEKHERHEKENAQFGTKEIVCCGQLRGGRKTRMDKRLTECMAEEWRKQVFSGQVSCRTSSAAAFTGSTVVVGWISAAHPPSPAMGGCATLIHPTSCRLRNISKEVR